jgi:DNA repair exonuclease SbcCD ATPase subunit
MRYMKELILRSFQSHKNSSIIFGDPGQVTGIVGPTGNGKTAILRALKWICHNTPTGDDFISVGDKECRVAVAMNDETLIERHRSKGGVNRYSIFKDGQVQKYESFGFGVPDEVQAALGVSPLTIGDQSFMLNFSGQLDGPFLGNDLPASARAKVLGKLSGVEEVDHAGKLLGIDLFRLKRDAEAWEAQCEMLNNQLNQYEYLEDLGQLIKQITQQINEVEDAEFRLSKMQRIYRETTNLEETKRGELDKVSGLQWSLNLQRVQDAHQKESLSNRLQSIRADLSLAQNMMTGATGRRIEANRALAVISPYLIEAEAQLSKLGSLMSWIRSRNDLQYAIEKCNLRIQKSGTTTEADIDRLAIKSKTLQDIRSLLQEMNDELSISDELKRKLAFFSMDIGQPIEQAVRTFESIKKLSDLLIEVDDLTEQVYCLRHDLTVVRSIESDALDEYKEFTKDKHICPLCNQPVTEWRI